MSSSGCSPSKSSALQDDPSASSSKRLRIRFLMKRQEVQPNTEEGVCAGVRKTSEDSGSKAPGGNFITILNDEWPSWFTGRRGRKRKPSNPADGTETPESATSMITTKEESKASPITGEASTSTLFMASAHNAAEHEATTDHVICNNKGKSVLANEEPKTHKCKSCPAAFATGQQLGGHLRAHFKGTLTVSTSSKRAKGKGTTRSGSSSETARDKAQVGSSSPQSLKDKDSNTSSSTEDRTKDTVAAYSSSRSVTREFFIPFDLNEPALPEEEEQLNIHEGDQILELTLSLSTRYSPN